MTLEGKRILVTGSSGFIGSNLVSRLKQIPNTNIKVTFHNKVHIHPNIIGVRADLTQPKDCDEIMSGIDVVFHCAANSSGAATHAANPTSMARDNTVMNANILDACYRSGVQKFVWLASTTGYPEVNHPVTEDEMFVGDPFDKYFAVGWMKRYTEKLCELYSVKSNSKMSCVVLRPTNIFGPNDKIDPKRSHVLPALIRKIIEKQNPIEIWGDGTEVRDVLYVDDMVEAMIMAAEKIEGFNQFNIGMGKSYSIMELLSIIKQVANYDAPHKFVPTTAKMIPFREVCVDKAKNILGWEPKYSTHVGIQKTYDWMKSELTK